MRQRRVLELESELERESSLESRSSLELPAFRELPDRDESTLSREVEALREDPPELDPDMPPSPCEELLRSRFELLDDPLFPLWSPLFCLLLFC
jgi:hypothetical protein